MKETWKEGSTRIMAKGLKKKIKKKKNKWNAKNISQLITNKLDTKAQI